jgi:hypothetical protein
VRTLRQAGVEGDILAWKDALHEGPVPAQPPAELARTRAHFLAAATNGSASSIERQLRNRDRALEQAPAAVLWFEADLYDQLQLIQVLARLKAPATLVSIGEYPGRAHFGGLGELSANELKALRNTDAIEVDAEARELATEAWAAFTAPDPRALIGLKPVKSRVLRFLGEAIERLLQEYPWMGDGLSLTERRVLHALDAGATTKQDVFRHLWQVERRPFLGDTWCYRTIDRLIGAGLVAEQPALVRSRVDRLDEVDRWIGGVHLKGRPRWRWDAAAETLLPP